MMTDGHKFTPHDSGFNKCEFGPEDNSPCERCRGKNKQLYYRGDPAGEHGEYWCEQCIKERGRQ